jgi:hypothetical protein
MKLKSNFIYFLKEKKAYLTNGINMVKHLILFNTYKFVSNILNIVSI